jgi:hypothetical protein
LIFGLVNDKDILGRMFKTYIRRTHRILVDIFWLKKLCGRFKSSSRLQLKKKIVNDVRVISSFSFSRKCGFLQFYRKYNEILDSVNAGYFLDYLE